MTVEANLRWIQFRIIKKHLRAAMGNAVDIGKEQPIKEMSNEYIIEPKWGRYTYKTKGCKKTNGKKAKQAKHEEIDYGNTTLKENIETKLLPHIKWDADGKVVKYGYKTFSSESGVDFPIGADHGVGALSAFAKLNLSSPQERRHSGKPGDGCLEFQVGYAECTKDNYDVLENTIAPNLSEGIKELATSKLVVVSNGKKTEKKTAISAKRIGRNGSCHCRGC